MHVSQKNVHTLAKNKIQKIAKAKFKWKKLSKKYSQKTSDCRWYIPHLFDCKLRLIHFFSSFRVVYNQGQFTFFIPLPYQKV